MAKKALIIVDVQNDFIEGGSLAVSGGEKVANSIASYLADNHEHYDLTVTTQDWHIDPKGHFSDQPDYIDTWPPHCLARHKGSELHHTLTETLTTLPHERVYKGEYTAAYSGFEGASGALDEEPDDNIWVATLHQILKEYKITEIHIVGLAYDYCVKQTAIDGAGRQYDTRIIRPLTASIHNSPETDEEIRNSGATIMEGLPQW